MCLFIREKLHLIRLVFSVRIFNLLLSITEGIANVPVLIEDFIVEEL